MNKLETALIERLDQEGIAYDGIDNCGDTSYEIEFHDHFGNGGSIEILIAEDADKYELSTSKEKDDYECCNQKKVKSVKAVMTYISKHMGL